MAKKQRPIYAKTTQTGPLEDLSEGGREDTNWGGNGVCGETSQDTGSLPRSTNNNYNI
jgi:hypothetical protein